MDRLCAASLDLRIEQGDLTGAGEAARHAIARIGLPQLLVVRPQLVGRWASLLGPEARTELNPFPPLRAEMFDTAGYFLARAQVEEVLHRDARASFDSAASAYQRRLRDRPDEPWDHSYLGQAYAGLGRREDAAREGRRAVELMPITRDAWEGPDLSALLMTSCLRFGDHEGAVQAALQFTATQPGNRLLVRYEPRIPAHPRRSAHPAAHRSLAEDVKSETSLLDAAHHLAAAEHQGDVATIEQLLAADYQGHDPVGRPQDRAGVLRAYTDGGLRLTNVQLSELQARIIGETGLVTGISSLQGQQGAEHFHFQLRFLEVYAWRADRWELVASQNTRLPW